MFVGPLENQISILKNEILRYKDRGKIKKKLAVPQILALRAMENSYIRNSS